MTKDTGHIQVIDVMRGIAALSVAICHLGGSVFEHWPELGNIFGYGQLGVHVFFVISGFVMPWSLEKTSYVFSGLLRFLARRSIRIDPPYFLTIALTLLLGLLVTLRPGYAGEPYLFEPLRFMFHLGYLIPFSEYTWYNNVFWTLAIEFQYYLIIGMVFPLMIRFKWFLFIFLIAFASVPELVEIPRDDLFIFRYQGLFAMGIIAWWYRKKRLNGWLCHALALAEFALVIYQFHLPAAIAGLASYLLISLVNADISYGKWLGKISYSLYLTHPLLITLSSGIVRRLPQEFIIRIPVALGLTGVALIFAYFFWKWVELPSQSLARTWVPNKPKK